MPIVAVRVVEAGNVEVADRMAEHARVEEITISDEAPLNAALVKMKLLLQVLPIRKIIVVVRPKAVPRTSTQATLFTLATLYS